jgi:hypothetical protein
LRSVVVDVLVEVPFEPEAGVRCVITEKSVRGSDRIKRSTRQPRAHLCCRLQRRFVENETPEVALGGV